jgi:hypothetical protein
MNPFSRGYIAKKTNHVSGFFVLNCKTISNDVMLLGKGLLYECFPIRLTFITEEETQSNTNIAFAWSSRTIAPNQHPLSGTPKHPQYNK